MCEFLTGRNHAPVYDQTDWALQPLHLPVSWVLQQPRCSAGDAHSAAVPAYGEKGLLWWVLSASCQPAQDNTTATKVGVGKGQE